MIQPGFVTSEYPDPGIKKSWHPAENQHLGFFFLHHFKVPRESMSDDAKLNKMFDSFASEDDPEIIDMDGIDKLAGQIGITDTAEDVRALVLVWKLGACTVEPLKPCCIKRNEFLGEMKKMRKDKIGDLAQMLPTLDPGFMESKEFKEFYRFVHKFSREENTQKKFLETEMVIALLPIVLDKNRAPHLDLFIQYLESLPPTQTITADQWDSFLGFNEVVDVTLEGFEDDGAWPLLLDEYVEWRREQSK